ncbi:MAG: pilus assembly protein PilM [Candidatus Omnitrophica bacterium]|nr:pilus assembly protein PilM [Candidatus Omnitrophota bacterium]
MKNKNLLVLEFNKQSLKFCLFQGPERKRLVKALSSEKIKNNDFSSAANEVLTRFYKKEETEVSISLSRYFFLMRYLKLPSLDPQEIDKMLSFQLFKTIPHTLDDVIYDYVVFDQSREFSKVLVFIIQKNKLGSILGFVKESRLTPLSITISSQGLFNWLMFAKYPALSPSKDPAAIIDINNDCAELLIFHKKKILFARSFDYSSQKQLLEEINHSLAIFQKEFGYQKLSEAVFTGLEKKELINSISFVKTSYLPWAGNFDFDKAINLDIRKGESYASVLGLATGREKDDFNFSPEFVARASLQLASRQKYNQYFFTGMQLLCILIMLFSVYLIDRRQYLRFLNHKLTGEQGEVQGLDLLASRLKVLDQEFLKKPFFSRMFYELVSNLPSNIQFTLLEVKENDELTLKGYADDISEVFKVVQVLNSLKLFDEVKVKYASEIKRQGRVKIEFYIYGERNKRG